MVHGVLGAQIRFEMPALMELEPVRLPGHDAACIAVIERAVKRLVVYQLAEEPIEPTGNRDAAITFTPCGATLPQPSGDTR